MVQAIPPVTSRNLQGVAESLCLIRGAHAEHGCSESRTLERTDTYARRSSSRYPLPDSPIGRDTPIHSSLHWWSQQAWRVVSRRYGYRSSDRCPNTIAARRRRLPLRSLALHRRTYHSYLRHRILSPRHCHAPRSHRSAYSPRSALVPLDGHPRRTTSARLLLLVRHR